MEPHLDLTKTWQGHFCELNMLVEMLWNWDQVALNSATPHHYLMAQQQFVSVSSSGQNFLDC